MPRPRRSSAAVLAVPLVVVGVLLFWLVVVPARIQPAPATGPRIVAWDLYSYFLPKLRWGTEELLAGRLPLWNRFEFAGIPFLATAQPAALYPPKLLVFGALDGGPALVAFLVAASPARGARHALAPPPRRRRAARRARGGDVRGARRAAPPLALPPEPLREPRLDAAPLRRDGGHRARRRRARRGGARARDRDAAHGRLSGDHARLRAPPRRARARPSRDGRDGPSPRAAPCPPSPEASSSASSRRACRSSRSRHSSCRRSARRSPSARSPSSRSPA